MTTEGKKKLIVFDTDGVIFKSHLLLRISWHTGILNYARALYLSFLFSISCLNTRQLLERLYIKLKGLKEEEMYKVYHNMKLVKYAGETIQYIRDNGHSVIFISSGVPDFLMKDLSGKLRANCGYGIEVKVHNGMCTGEIGGLLSSQEGKVQAVEQILCDYKMTWDDVIAVGDDRNNLDIMLRAGASIGFNSNYPVRRKAKYLVDGNDLRMILDYIRLEDEPSFTELSSSIKREFSFSWKQEFRRKGVHVCAAFIPFLVNLHYLLTLKALIVMSVLYMFAELLRLNGIPFPVLNFITRSCIRSRERRRVAIAPITLATGIIISLLLYPATVAYVAIIIVSCSDSMASIVGRYYGRIRIPYSRKKSVEGSLAFFVTSFICVVFFAPLKIALIVSFISCIIESLPVKFDNITIPLGTGLFLGLLI